MEHKKSKKLYALKYIDKAKCIKQKAVANIIQERRLLEEVSIPCSLASASRAAGRPSCWPTRLLLVPHHTLPIYRPCRLVSTRYAACDMAGPPEHATSFLLAAALV